MFALARYAGAVPNHTSDLTSELIRAPLDAADLRPRVQATIDNVLARQGTLLLLLLLQLLLMLLLPRFPLDPGLPRR